jgi:hypothetical protein
LAAGLLAIGLGFLWHTQAVFLVIGVVLVIPLRLPQDEPAKAMPEVERDEHGHVRLAELERRQRAGTGL